MKMSEHQSSNDFYMTKIIEIYITDGIYTSEMLIYNVIDKKIRKACCCKRLRRIFSP